MAQVIVNFRKAGAPTRYGFGVPVYEIGGHCEELASGATAVATSMTANAGDICTVYNAGSALIWAKIGAGVTASVEDLHPVGPGLERDFGPCGDGDICSVIDDS